MERVALRIKVPPQAEDPFILEFKVIKIAVLQDFI
jgi:hypothetical protein